MLNILLRTACLTLVTLVIYWRGATNRPFPSSKKPHFQNEAKFEAIDMKMIFNYYANKTHFHNKGFAFGLVLKVRFFGTRKWPITLSSKLSYDQDHVNGHTLGVYPTSFPWVPETFLARFPVSVKSLIRDVSAISQHRKFPLHARKTSGTQGRRH